MGKPDQVQVIMPRHLFKSLQGLFLGHGIMAVPLPPEITGEGGPPTFVIWPLEQAVAAGFTTENTVTFGQSESTPTERSNTNG